MLNPQQREWIGVHIIDGDMYIVDIVDDDNRLYFYDNSGNRQPSEDFILSDGLTLSSGVISGTPTPPAQLSNVAEPQEAEEILGFNIDDEIREMTRRHDNN